MAGARAPWLVAAIAQAIAIVGVSGFLAKQGAAVEAHAPTQQAPPDADPADGTDVGQLAAAADATPSSSGRETAPRAGADGAAAAPDDLGTLLHGRVTTRDGGKFEGAQMNLSIGEETKPIASAHVRAVQAQFAFAGLEPGEYCLRARVRGYRDVEQHVTIEAGVPALRIDVELQPSWIVKVALLAPDGRPLHEALAEAKVLPEGFFGEAVHVVAAWRALPAQLPLSDLRETPLSVGTWTSSRMGMRRGGGSDLPARFAGALEMREKRDAFVAAVYREVVLVQQAVAAGQEELTLTVDPQQLRASAAAVRLQVVDGATGAPVPEARVTLDDAQTSRTPVAVDAEGRYEQANLRPGRYRLAIFAPDRVAPTATVDLKPGHTTDLGAIAVLDGVELRLRVPDLADDAPSGSLQPLDGTDTGVLRAAPIRFGLRQGEATVRVAPGRYRLRLQQKGRGASVEIDTRRTGGEPIVVALVDEPSVRIDPNAVDEPVRCEIRTPNGHVVYDRWITWRRPYEVQVPSGDYRVRIERLDGTVRDEALTVPAAGTTFVLR